MELHRTRRGSRAAAGDVKDRFPDVPWQQPARLRNRIVHGYWSIDLEILHTTATNQLPAFARDLREVLDILTADTDEAPPAQGVRRRPQRRAQSDD